MAAVGTLEDEALKRKARLKNLRNKTGSSEDTKSPNTSSDQDNIKLPRPVFRSYKPLDDNLKDSSRPVIKPADVTEKIQTQIEAAKTEKVVDEVDLINLAPRKPDWDLKRDVAKKLEKLERRTQRAIAELIRERLKSGTGDLAQVVNAGGAPETADDEDEEDD